MVWLTNSHGQIELEVNRDGIQNHVPQLAFLGKGQNALIRNAESDVLNLYDFKGSISFKVVNQFNDQLDYQHIRLQQYANDIPVETGHLVLHLKQNELHSISGDALITSEFLDQTPIVASNHAIDTALSQFESDQFAWDNESLELSLKERLNDPDATYYPNVDLIYVREDHEDRNYKLAYKIIVSLADPFTEYNVYVDAILGTVIRIDSLQQECTTLGTGEAIYEGNVNLITDNTNGSEHRLFSCNFTGNIHTRDLQNGTNFNTAIDITNNGLFWSAINHPTDQAGIDVHWGMHESYDFLLGFGFNGYGNNGEDVNSYINYGNNYVNAFFSPNQDLFAFGAGANNSEPLVTLDIVGHEFWHAVTHNTAGLIYAGESGALNESWSDIFGTGIENESTVQGFDWLIGDDLPIGAFRDMSNPNAFNQPDCYNGVYYVPGGSVHNNNGIGNHWFYLLTDGGSGVNDCGKAYTVNGIGLNQALQIAFRALTVYMTPGTTFEEAREHCIQSAEDIFGACSPQYIATMNAWYAVCVGEEFRGFDAPTGLFEDPVSMCSALLNWDDMGAEHYNVCYREVGTLSWTCGSVFNTSILINNLDPGTTYEWRVHSVCGTSVSDWSYDEFTTSERCNPPGNIVLDDLTTCSASLSWDNLSGNGYTVQFRECGSLFWTTINTNTNSVDLNTLDPGTCYELRVSTNCGCVSSLFGRPFEFETDKCPPSEITNTFVTACEVTVLFTHVPDATYRLEWRETGTPGWNSTTGNFTFPNTTRAFGTQPGTSYDIRVVTICQGVNCTSESVSPITTVTTPAVAPSCEPPVNVDIDIFFGIWVQIQIDPSPNATSHEFRVRYDPGDPFSAPTTVNNNTWMFGGTVDCYLEIEVRSRCTCQNGPAEWSQWESYIYDSDDFECLDLDAFSHTEFCNNRVRLYTNTRLCSDTYNWRYRRIAPPPTTAWVNVSNSDASLLITNGLEDGATYEWQVQLECEDGTVHPWSASQFFTMIESCQNPENTGENLLSTTSVELFWDMVTGAANYELEYRVQGTTNWIGPIILAANTTSMTLNGLTAGETYEWRIRSVCENPSFPTFCPEFSPWSEDLFTLENCEVEPFFDWRSEECYVEFADESIGINITSWHWTFGDGNESFNQNTSHTYDFSGSYEVCLTVECNNLSSTAMTYCEEVTVNCCDYSPPTGLDCEILGNELILTWDPVSGATNYQVLITQNDPACCGDEGRRQESVSSDIRNSSNRNQFVLSWPQKGYDCFSWQVRALCDEQWGDWSDIACAGDDYCPIVGKVESNLGQISADVKIYPNPMNDEVNINMILEDPAEITYEIRNQIGQLIGSKYLGHQPIGRLTETIDLNAQVEGVYYLIIYQNDTPTWHKVVKVDGLNSRP